MAEAHSTQIADELNITVSQVRAVASLLTEGSTVPFIARYRKEQTGSLDEVAITTIRDRMAQLARLDGRREVILRSLEEQELLSDELREAIETAQTMTELEDIYLPYRPKRRTRATVAREKGLDPLAEILLAQGVETRPLQEADLFVNEERGVATAEDALAGARDIIAEGVGEDAEARQFMRRLFAAKGTLRSSVVEGGETPGATYRDYFDWEEPAGEAPSHRVLAMFRGEREGHLKLILRPPEEDALLLLLQRFVKNQSSAAEQVTLAVEDGYKRLLASSMETELRHEAKERADHEAIRVFAQNLRQLLMAPPLGQRSVLAIDPGYRTGGKVVCLNPQGKLEYHTTIFITQSERQREEAAATLRHLCERFSVEAIAIGNGTASRETETFVRELGLPRTVSIVLVNESGASVYSASEAAREEFPDHDVTVRGAVSIGRRLMDPLAELVKIDPKALGVGQYQHDVDQSRLRQSLDDVVTSCVNAVGVEVNTASQQLLTYVSGLGPALARNIVAYRDQNGPFRSREELRKVRRLGPKAFEQAAGFLRISDAQNPLDATAVHPESYSIVHDMARDLDCSLRDLMRQERLRRQIDLYRYTSDSVGFPTLTDILEELAKPGRDPRETFEPFAFVEGITTLDDLEPGLKLPGVVTNITNFGAFVDIGVHQDGLVHVSQLADHFVKRPADVVQINQRVTVTVLEVDRDRNRISLSMRQDPTMSKRRR